MKIVAFCLVLLQNSSGMTLCPPQSSQWVVDAFAALFQINSEPLRRKIVFNGIIYFYSFRVDHLLTEWDFEQHFDLPIGKGGYDLSKQSSDILKLILKRIEQKKDIKLEDWKLAHLLIQQANVERSVVIPYLIDYIRARTKVDPNQICFALNVPLRAKIEKVQKRIKSKETLLEYIAQSLDLFTSNKTEDEIKEKLVQFSGQKPKNDLHLGFKLFILTADETTLRRLSGFTYDSQFSSLVEMAIEARAA